MTGQPKYKGKLVATILKLKREGRPIQEIAAFCDGSKHLRHPSGHCWLDTQIGYIYNKHKEYAIYHPGAPGADPNNWPSNPSEEKKPRAEKPINPISLTDSPDIRAGKVTAKKVKQPSGESAQENMDRLNPLPQANTAQWPSSLCAESAHQAAQSDGTGLGAMQGQYFWRHVQDNAQESSKADLAAHDQSSFDSNMLPSLFGGDWSHYPIQQEQFFEPQSVTQTCWPNQNWSYSHPSQMREILDHNLARESHNSEFELSNLPTSHVNQDAVEQGYAPEAKPGHPNSLAFVFRCKQNNQNADSTNLSNWNGSANAILDRGLSGNLAPQNAFNENDLSNFAMNGLAGSEYMLPEDCLNSFGPGFVLGFNWPVAQQDGDGLPILHTSNQAVGHGTNNTTNLHVKFNSANTGPQNGSVVNSFHHQPIPDLQTQNPHHQHYASRNSQNVLAADMRKISGGPLRSSLEAAQPINILNAGLPASSENRMLQHAIKAQAVGLDNIQLGTTVDTPYAELYSSPHKASSSNSIQAPAIAVVAQRRAMQAARNLSLKNNLLMANSPAWESVGVPKAQNGVKSNNIARQGPIRELMAKSAVGSRNGSGFAAPANPNAHRVQHFPTSDQVASSKSRQPSPQIEVHQIGTTQQLIDHPVADSGVWQDGSFAVQPLRNYKLAHSSQGGQNLRIAHPAPKNTSRVSKNTLHLGSGQSRMPRCQTHQADKGVSNYNASNTSSQISKLSFDSPSATWMQKNDVFSSPGTLNASNRQFNERLQRAAHPPSNDGVGNSQNCSFDSQSGGIEASQSGNRTFLTSDNLNYISVPEIPPNPFQNVATGGAWNNNALNSFDFGLGQASMNVFESTIPGIASSPRTCTPQRTVDGFNVSRSFNPCQTDNTPDKTSDVNDDQWFSAFEQMMSDQSELAIDSGMTSWVFDNIEKFGQDLSGYVPTQYEPTMQAAEVQPDDEDLFGDEEVFAENTAKSQAGEATTTSGSEAQNVGENQHMSGGGNV